MPASQYLEQKGTFLAVEESRNFSEVEIQWKILVSGRAESGKDKTIRKKHSSVPKEIFPSWNMNQFFPPKILNTSKLKCY